MATIVTASGARKDLPDTIDREQLVGLDADGRIVVDFFGARTATDEWATGTPYVFGLTLCCNASDKGMEDGVGCRGCYGLPGEVARDRNGLKVVADAGEYHYRDDDGTFPSVDLTDHIEE